MNNFFIKSSLVSKVLTNGLKLSEYTYLDEKENKKFTDIMNQKSMNKKFCLEISVKNKKHN